MRCHEVSFTNCEGKDYDRTEVNGVSANQEIEDEEFIEKEAEDSIENLDLILVKCGVCDYEEIRARETFSSYGNFCDYCWMAVATSDEVQEDDLREESSVDSDPSDTQVVEYSDVRKVVRMAAASAKNVQQDDLRVKSSMKSLELEPLVARFEKQDCDGQESQHEKIVRGLAVGISLVMYGRLEEADPLIESLTRDKDAILRRSGMYTIAAVSCSNGTW